MTLQFMIDGTLEVIIIYTQVNCHLVYAQFVYYPYGLISI